MTTITTPTEPLERKHVWRRRITWIAALVITLIIGVAIGAAGNDNSSALHQANVQAAAYHRQLQAANSAIQGLRDSNALYKQQAAQATAKANTAAAAKYAARESKLSAKLAQAAALQRKLNRQEGVVQSSTISDGVYVVGKDIPAGTYHTNGGNNCYYATLTSTNTSDIIDNNITSGPATVSTGGAYALDLDGGCTWHKIG